MNPHFLKDFLASRIRAAERMKAKTYDLTAIDRLNAAITVYRQLHEKLDRDHPVTEGMYE